MRKQIASAALTLPAVVFSIACGGAAPMVSPTQAPATALSISVQALVVGMGVKGEHGQGVTLSIWAGSPVTVSARLEVGFAGASISIPFDPASVRIGADGRGTLSTSVPGSDDPRFEGRTPTSFRAAVTARDDAGSERTLFVDLSAFPR